MDWIILVISTICFVGIFFHLNILARIEDLNKILLKIFKTIQSPHISDHWKEKVLLPYSLQLLTASLTIFVLFLVSFSPLIICSLLSIMFEGQFFTLASSFKGIVTSSIISILFAMFLLNDSKKDYGFGSRILHQIVLGNSFFGETLFDIEKLFHGSKAKNIYTGNHVFVAGLARAGTTILMRKLYENNKFCSLTYRDMPFILAPNTWHIISNLSIKKTKMQERAHADGIEVDYDSPEALEEVFWRTFCGADYIKQNYLIPMVAPHETIEKFRSFISIILKNENNKSYLSKNNNNILRLSSIVKAFPNALIIVPFREPLQQAYSLRKQHQRFKHSGGQFTNKYMYWLAHHEFGADHRPFIFDENIEDKTDTENLSYWLRLWINTYSYILKNRPVQVIFLSYEELCDNTEYIWEKLSEKIELSPYIETISFSKSLNEINEDLPCNILSHATELYEELNSNSIGFSRK